MGEPHILDGDLRITRDTLAEQAEPMLVASLAEHLDRLSVVRRESLKALEIGLRGSLERIGCRPSDAQVVRASALIFDRICGILIGHANDLAGVPIPQPEGQEP